MELRRSYLNSNLRFKRWSRKAYAIFLSLGREVTIGKLSVQIADASSRKQENKGFEEIRFSNEDLKLEEKEELMSLQEPVLVAVLSENVNEVAASFVASININPAGEAYACPAFYFL